MICVADFETTTDLNDCRVWAWAVCDIEKPDDVIMGNDIRTFIDYTKENNGDYYFHNLAFDGEFILNWLFRNGYKYSEKSDSKTFQTLISKTGKWYSMKVTHEKSGHKKLNSVEFKDSLKKLPMSVSRIAKAFGLEESKLEIDYDEKRAIGHELTEQEKAYIRNDVIIVAKALKIQFGSNLTKLTVGADALEHFSKPLGKGFRKVFPELPLGVDADIRLAYKGGYTYANPKFQGKDLASGNVYDVNSLYPYVMHEKMLPWGTPIYNRSKIEPDENYPLTVQSLVMECELKPNGLPCLQIKNNPFYAMNEYIAKTDAPVNLTLTNVDFDLLSDNYNILIHEYCGGYKFHARNDMFTDYIDYWMGIKKTSAGGKRQLAKLMLNSLYGKFATNPDVTGKVPFLGGDGAVHYKLGDEDTRKPVYTPLGVFVTAWARDYTIRNAMANLDRFAYADTDSLHLVGDAEPKGLNVDTYELGAWKHESHFDRARFIRAKTYIELIDGDINVKCAGLPDNLKKQVDFNNFKRGLKLDGKLMPKHVAGGIVLQPTTFTMI